MKNMALHILDIVQNSITAGASLINITIDEVHHGDMLMIEIRDNGSGMSKEMLDHVTDPYTTSRTTRKVGLGIPLFKRNAEQCEGNFSIQSLVGEGTTTTALFKTNHPDTPPWGICPAW